MPDAHAPIQRWPRLRAWLSRPAIVGWVAVIGALVFAQGLLLGFQADDVWHQIFLERDPRWTPAIPASRLDLFTFYPGDPAQNQWLIDQGIASWWSDPAVRIAFFRPLTALTHLFDHAVAPGSAVFAHAHTLVWYAALVAAVAALYRRVMGSAFAAGLAAYFYAVDYNHGVIATWIANRSALVTGALGIFALVLHARARAESRRSLSALSALLFAGALFAGEMGVGAAAWFAAWVIVMDRGDLRARIAPLAPHVAAAVAWAIVYRRGDWGAHHSGVYTDPLRDPLPFALGLFEKVPVLVAAEFGGPGPDIALFGPRSQQLAVVALAVPILAGAVIAIGPIIARSREARFFALGAALSLVPACATFASVRQLVLPGVGLVGLAAQLVAEVVDASPAAVASGARRRVILAYTLFVGSAHAVFAPVTAQAAARQLWFLERMIHRWSDPIADAGLADQRLVVVNAPSVTFAQYIPARRWVDGRAVPRGLLTIGSGTRGLTLDRPDASTLIARQEGGFAVEALESLTAPRDRRWSPGDRVRVGEVRVEVLEVTEDAHPLRVAFRFPTPLEDRSLRFVTWDGAGLAPFDLPAAGGHRAIAGQALSPF